MSSAGTSGTGFAFVASFAPTERARLLGPLTPNGYNEIWTDLQKCAPFPAGLNQDEVNSLFEQMVCHVLYGFTQQGGDTFDLEAWRPLVPSVTALNPKNGCDWRPAQSVVDGFLGHIVHWGGDTSSQRAAWLIVGSPGNLRREWIPTTDVYFCLQSQGHPGPDDLAASFMHTYMADDLSEASCTSSGGSGGGGSGGGGSGGGGGGGGGSGGGGGGGGGGVQGFHIEDDYLGGTWARNDPNDGTWYSHANQPVNSPYWYPNGLGVGVDCARSAATYTVHFFDGHTEVWSTWFHVTDGEWFPSAASTEATADGFYGLPAC